MTLRSRLATSLSVQQLFAQPTVRGICGGMRDAEATAPSLSPSPQLRLICLQPGSTSHAPLVLIHPAGASSLCYLPLVRSLGAHLPVYALDDSYLTGGSAFGFSSIEAVAAECASLLTAELCNPAPRDLRITLGGWSYGGVVALQVAELLRQRQDTCPLAVHAVLLFDAPLGQTRGRGFLSDESTLVETIRQQLAPLVESGAALDNLTMHTTRHFVECNRLLDIYEPRASLSSPIIDVRPAASECRFLASLTHLTSAAVHEIEVCGTHWTMLFDQHTRKVAEAIAPFLPDPRECVDPSSVVDQRLR